MYIPTTESLTFANGGITNNGTITVGASGFFYDSYLTFSGSTTLSGTGSVVLNGDAYLNTSNSGLLTQAAGHTISGQGTIAATLNNLGIVEAQNGLLTVAGAVTQFSGGTLAGGTWIAEPIRR